jgi:hypothetical protein
MHVYFSHRYKFVPPQKTPTNFWGKSPSERDKKIIEKKLSPGVHDIELFIAFKKLLLYTFFDIRYFFSSRVALRFLRRNQKRRKTGADARNTRLRVESGRKEE